MADKAGKTSAGNIATDHIQTLRKRSDALVRSLRRIMAARTPTIWMIACRGGNSGKPRESCRFAGTQPIEGGLRRAEL